MYFLSFVVLLLVAAVTGDDDCPKDKSQLAPIKLRKDLLCGYDRSTRPTINHKNAVPVVMRMILKYFAFDIHDSSFVVDSWMAMFWKDEHLKWNPDDYESIKSIHLSDVDIWMPDISVYNRRDQGGDPSAIGTVTCVVSSEGQVVCVPPSHHNSLCVADLTKYPFDTHNCTIRFGSWVHSGEELDIRVAKPGISTEDLVPNGEWALADTNVIKHPGKFKCCPNNTYPSINFSFKIKRVAGAHTATVILPAIALIIITLTSLWIAPNNSERLNLCYMNVICQFLYVQYVSYMLPLNGVNIPLIILFARDSLLISAFTIVFSVMLKSMVENKKAAPEWITKVVCVLVAFKPGQIVFLNDASFKGLKNSEGDDDGAAIISVQEGSSGPKEWFLFAKILDRLCFAIFLTIYISMFISFTP